MGFITPPPVAWDVRSIIIIGLEVRSHFSTKHNLINISLMNETEELLRPQMKKKQTMRRNMKQKIKRKTAIQQYENTWLLMVSAMCTALFFIFSTLVKCNGKTL